MVKRLIGSARSEKVIFAEGWSRYGSTEDGPGVGYGNANKEVGKRPMGMYLSFFS